MNIAEEVGIAAERFPEFEGTWWAGRLDPSIPDRYQRLVRDVVYRLPENWDAHCTWSVMGSGEGKPRGFGSALREEEGEGDHDQIWLVTLYPALLDRLSDAACRWVIAHELAHVASGIPTGSIAINGTPYTRVKGVVDQYQEAPSKQVHEDASDEIALGWGFSDEMQVFLAEDR